jgi:hypothetical protein
MGKGFGTVDPALFDLARTIAIAKVRLCYGRGDICNRVVEKLERMSNENYELNPDPHMDMGLASARAVLTKYQVKLKDTGV